MLWFSHHDERMNASKWVMERQSQPKKRKVMLNIHPQLNSLSSFVSRASAWGGERVANPSKANKWARKSLGKHTHGNLERSSSEPFFSSSPSLKLVTLFFVWTEEEGKGIIEASNFSLSSTMRCAASPRGISPGNLAEDFEERLREGVKNVEHMCVASPGAYYLSFIQANFAIWLWAQAAIRFPLLSSMSYGRGFHRESKQYFNSAKTSDGALNFLGL